VTAKIFFSARCNI